MKRNEVQGDWDFASIFISLISSRPSVCAEALDRFSDLRLLGIRTVFQAFQSCVEGAPPKNKANAVEITLCPSGGGKQVILSVPLLQASAVLLSIWKETKSSSSSDNKEENPDKEEAASYIHKLVDMLLHPMESEDGADNGGLASAKIVESGISAVFVESVSSLQSALLGHRKLHF